MTIRELDSISFLISVFEFFGPQQSFWKSQNLPCIYVYRTNIANLLIFLQYARSAADEKYVQKILAANAGSSRIWICDARPKINAQARSLFNLAASFNKIYLSQIMYSVVLAKQVTFRKITDKRFHQETWCLRLSLLLQYFLFELASFCHGCLPRFLLISSPHVRANEGPLFELTRPALGSMKQMGFFTIWSVLFDNIWFMSSMYPEDSVSVLLLIFFFLTVINSYFLFDFIISEIAVICRV